MIEAHDCNFRPDLGLGCINDRCPLHRAMRVFVANLSIGAALCRAFSQGAVYMARSVMRPDAEEAFTPGCGRSAP